MGQLQASASPATISNAASVPGELNILVGVSELYQANQGGGIPGLFGSTTVGFPAGGGLGIGGTPSGSGVLPQGIIPTFNNANPAPKYLKA